MKDENECTWEFLLEKSFEAAFDKKTAKYALAFSEVSEELGHRVVKQLVLCDIPVEEAAKNVAAILGVINEQLKELVKLHPVIKNLGIGELK